MDVLLIHPPATKPAEPPLGVAVLLGHLRRRGLTAEAIDANLAAYLYLLDPGRLADAAGEQPPTPLRRAVMHAERSLELLRSPAGAESFARYGTAVRHLNEALGALRTTAGERVTLGDYVHPSISEFSPADLERLARGEVETLFATYFRDVLLPRILDLQPRVVALSVNYRHQVLPAFELAGQIRRALPQARIVAGGGMFSSWRATLPRLGLRFDAFDHVVFGPGERPLEAIAAGAAPDYFLEDPAEVDFAPDFSFAPFDEYLSPHPVVPVSATRGCYWRKCLFCPEAAAPTHPYRCEDPAGFVDMLLDLQQRHGVRHFHLTDNAIPVKTLRAMAARADELAGMSWHGFVRFERALLEPALAEGLARAGCAMLQLGLESGSQPVLDRLGKGTRLDEVSTILRNLERAGIAAYAYIMLGTPGETQDDAERTRAFLEEHASAIDFLNIAIMNLPRDSELLAEPERHGIRTAALLDDGEPLGLYQSFEPTGGWDRGAARRFLDRRLLGSAPIREMVTRTPPLFTSNHAFFFGRKRSAPAAASR